VANGLVDDMVKLIVTDDLRTGRRAGLASDGDGVDEEDREAGMWGVTKGNEFRRGS